MIETWIAPGIWKLTEDRVRVFFGICDEGCHWMLSPEYLEGGWRVTHSVNPEALLRFERDAIPEPFDPAWLMDRIADWLERGHAYASTGAAHAGGEG